MVEYIVSCLRSEDLRVVAESFSPDFMYSSPRIKGYNFEQFCDHLENLSLHMEMEIIKFEQRGNVYIIDEIIQTVDNSKGYFHSEKIKVFVTVSDHLVQSIRVEFDTTSKHAIYLDSINPIAEKFRP